jgi:putative membrane protein
MAVTGFRSHILADWWLENLVVFAALLGLALAHKRLPLSNASYLLLFLFLCAHEYGASYAYSNAPLGEWMKTILHSDRNHYDRLVHFLFGLLLTLPIYEACVIRLKLSGWASYFVPLQIVMSASAIYEILEWIVAQAVDPKLGMEFIGAQGDVWDSPEDMAMALVGSCVAALILTALKRRR